MISLPDAIAEHAAGDRSCRQTVSHSTCICKSSDASEPFYAVLDSSPRWIPFCRLHRNLAFLRKLFRYVSIQYDSGGARHVWMTEIKQKQTNPPHVTFYAATDRKTITFSQSLHEKGRSFEWNVDSWIVRWSLRANALAQTLHLKGFSWVWIRIWRLRCVPLRNTLLQYSHVWLPGEALADFFDDSFLIGLRLSSASSSYSSSRKSTCPQSKSTSEFEFLSSAIGSLFIFFTSSSKVSTRYSTFSNASTLQSEVSIVELSLLKMHVSKTLSISEGQPTFYQDLYLWLHASIPLQRGVPAPYALALPLLLWLLDHLN